METIIKILGRVKGILATMEFRDSNYNRAAMQEMVSLIDAVINGIQLAEERKQKEETKP